MNATLPLCLAQALTPLAPPQSMVHQIVKPADLTEDQRATIDAAMHADKLVDGYAQRKYRSALALQVQANPDQWRAA